MANVGDDVLHNILARLPGKPLLRFRCASKHWNSLISDPYFMKSRSRRMILLPFLRPLAVVDDNVPAEDESHSTVRIPSFLEHQEDRYTEVSIIGTLNGIVLLAFTDEKFLRCQLILYNPLTCASKILLVMHMERHEFPHYVIGFGYGATKDDLKLVRFQFSDHPNRLRYKYSVFDLKTSSWSTPPQYLRRDFYFASNRVSGVGFFLNGVLYWLTSKFFPILALNLKEMVFSNIALPRGLTYGSEGLPFGSIDGRLCMINKIGTIRFDVWSLSKECSWTKEHSFTFGLEGNCFKVFSPLCILSNRKIFMKNSSLQLVIYDTSKGSYKMINGLASLDSFKRINTVSDLNRIDPYELSDIRSIEYVESLVSPSDMCLV